jgi:hypothetical protein
MPPPLEGRNGVAAPEAPLEPVIMDKKMKVNPFVVPKFNDPLEERDYLKGRLATAFRIFGKYGFDEGVISPSLLLGSNEAY